jgi:photosystem II stability/assembly factor-like uncharacterized protein
MGPTRFTQLLFDPVDKNIIWATVEIGGVYFSQDYGKSWQITANGMMSNDIHGICIVQGLDGKKVIYVTTNVGLHRSEDNGLNWVFVPLDSPWQYTRSIIKDVDLPNVIWLCNGNGPPGSEGKIWKSIDYGYSWSEVFVTEKFNSTPWCFALDQFHPELMFIGTNLGQIYTSLDHGDTWNKLSHEFGEIRSLYLRECLFHLDRAEHSITIRKPFKAAEFKHVN